MKEDNPWNKIRQMHTSNSKIDLSHLNSGIYTIEFDGENQLSNQRLVIQ